MEKKAGRVKAIIGTLYSGKSTQLIQDVERAALAKKHVLVIRPKLDSRDYLSRLIPSIDGVQIVKVEHLSEIKEIKTYDHIFIDEFQFFDESAVDEVNEIANYGVNVTIAALNANINQELFSSVAKLLPWCEEIIKLHSICPECGNEYAHIVYRADGGTDASVKKENVETSKEAEIYKICCRNCFYRMNTTYKKVAK